MFLYEGDCLKNVTVIRGVRYVTVSHYSGNKDVCDKLGDLLTDAFRSCDLHEVTNASSSDVDRQYEMTPSLVKRGFTCHT